MYNFNFFGLNFPKNGFRFWNSESKCRNLNQNLRDTMCANFWAKRTTLTFLAKICPKKDLGLEIQITNVEIRISILEIPCVRIFRQNEQLWLFWPKLAQKWIFGSEFSTWIRNQHLQIPCVPISSENGTSNFEFFGLNLGKLPNYVWYFGSNNVEGVAESWVEVEMS